MRSSRRWMSWMMLLCCAGFLAPLVVAADAKIPAETAAMPGAEAVQLKLEASDKVGEGNKRLLSIRITNVGSAALGGLKPLILELKLPKSLFSPDLLSLPTRGTSRVVSLSGRGEVKLEGAATAWSAWKGELPGNPEFRLLLTNGHDEPGKPGSGELKPGEALTLILETPPLNGVTMFDLPLRAGSALLKLPVQVVLKDVKLDASTPAPGGTIAPAPGNTGAGGAPGTSNTAPHTEEPDVRLWTDQESPLALAMGQEVEISWKVKNGISGKLLGPLPGGTSVLTLKDGQDEDYQLSRDSINVRAFQYCTWVLEAIVSQPGGPNLTVVKTVSLDVHSAVKRADLTTTPSTVLPFGDMTVHWASWGLTRAETDTLTTTWTDHDGYRQVRRQELEDGSGEGYLQFTAPGKGGADNAFVKLEFGGESILKQYDIVRWLPEHPMKQADHGQQGAHETWTGAVTGSPRGLAVVGDWLILETKDGLWKARIDDGSDGPNPFPKFRPIGHTKKEGVEWLALAGMSETFIALARLPNDSLKLVRFTAEGVEKESIELSSKKFHPRDHLQLLALKEKTEPLKDTSSSPATVIPDSNYRFYLLGQDTSRTTKAVSINFAELKASKDPQIEKLLGPRFLGADWTLITLSEAIYALNRKTGALMRFMVAMQYEDGSSLLFPQQATTAPVAWKKLVEHGLPLELGGMLVLLGSDDDAREGDSSIKRDLVYNPQTNAWHACGHGLNVQANAVAYYRRTGNPRIWLLQPDRSAYTLAVNSPELFDQDYIRGNKKSPTDYFGTEKIFTITNRSGAAIRWSGSAPTIIGLVEVDAASPKLIPPEGNRVVRIQYNEEEEVKLSVKAGLETESEDSLSGLVTITYSRKRKEWEFDKYSKSQFEVEIDPAKSIVTVGKRLKPD